MYEMVQKPSIKQLTLTYWKVTYNFRKEIKRQAKVWILISNQVTKGSFGPSFTTTKGSKKAY